MDRIQHLNTHLFSRISAELEKRQCDGTERIVRVYSSENTLLNLADNDYLGLSKHPEMIACAQTALEMYGTSASASPLVSGFSVAHERLLRRLKTWYGLPFGMVWNSGYAANHALLSTLPKHGDVVIADRLIHHSMISGILAGGARLMRYDHCDCGHLAETLERCQGKYAQIFVVTESVFSMDGDYPALAEIAELKRRYPFFWILDEAHAIGWFGASGSGLAEVAGVLKDVDVLVGTLGKGLGSQGAFTLFHDECLQRYLVNVAGEFIYSTFLAPVCAAVAEKAIELTLTMHELRGVAQAQSRLFRQRLNVRGFQVPDGDSSIVPIVLANPQETLAVAGKLAERGILVGAIRPPTVPQGGSRLRVSLKINFNDALQDSFIAVLEEALRQ